MLSFIRHYPLYRRWGGLTYPYLTKYFQGSPSLGENLFCVFLEIVAAAWPNPTTQLKGTNSTANEKAPTHPVSLFSQTTKREKTQYQQTITWRSLKPATPAYKPTPLPNILQPSAHYPYRNNKNTTLQAKNKPRTPQAQILQCPL